MGCSGMLSRSQSYSSHTIIFVSGRKNKGGAYRLDGPPTLPWQVLGPPITFSLTIDVRYMREAHTTKSPCLLQISGLAPSLLTTAHFLKDGGFSSIPSANDQHAKPITCLMDIFGWNVYVGEIYEAEESKWRWREFIRGGLRNWVGGLT